MYIYIYIYIYIYVYIAFVQVVKVNTVYVIYLPGVFYCGQLYFMEKDSIFFPNYITPISIKSY